MTPVARRSLTAAPAVAALAIGGVLLAWLRFGSAATRTGWYPAAADAAVDAGDYATAAVCYARERQSNPTDAALAFQLATALEQSHQVDAAHGLLVRLAPPDRVGYPPAQLLLVQQLLSTGDKTPTADALAEADHHLSPVLAAAPDDAEANVWSAVLSADRKQWDAARAAAAKVGPLRGVLAERLAKVAAAQHDAAQAAAWAAEAH